MESMRINFGKRNLLLENEGLNDNKRFISIDDHDLEVALLKKRISNLEEDLLRKNLLKAPESPHSVVGRNLDEAIREVNFEEEKKKYFEVIKSMQAQLSLLREELKFFSDLSKADLGDVKKELDLKVKVISNNILIGKGSNPNEDFVVDPMEIECRIKRDFTKIDSGEAVTGLENLERSNFNPVNNPNNSSLNLGKDISKGLDDLNKEKISLLSLKKKLWVIIAAMGGGCLFFGVGFFVFLVLFVMMLVLFLTK